jgi:hypothetical protein
MLNNFIEPYEEEIFYSLLARYHFYSANSNFKDSLKDLFGSSNVIPTILFPSTLQHFAFQFKEGSKLTAEYFIYKHTAFPFYAPFMPQSRKEKVLEEMKNSNSRTINLETGVAAGSICAKDSLYYCPLCAKEDLETLGESYFRRSHQLQGILVCAEHGCYLSSYAVSRLESSRIEAVRLENEKISFAINTEKNAELQSKLFEIAKGAKYILKNDLSEFNAEYIHEIYKNLLVKKGFTSVGGSINQSELHAAFTAFYGEELLSLLDSSLDRDTEWNWLKSITRKYKKVMHPVRHMLLMIFLYGSVANFFENTHDKGHLFGKGPWPCLNPAAPHYREMVVCECKVTADYKTRVPVGTFECSCGFIYSRKGPDKSKDDLFKIGTIKCFGHLWEEKLKELLKEGGRSIRSIANSMGCDSKTVKKYSERIKAERNTLKKESVSKISKNGYRERMLYYMMLNPDCTRKELRDSLYREFAWLYRNDKDWLYKNLPAKTEKVVAENHRVDWDSRDRELLVEIKNAYLEILKLEKPKRVTESLIGKVTGKDALLRYYIDKLPRCRDYMKEIAESIEDFQLRRIRIIYDAAKSNNVELKKWELLRAAGIRKEYVNRVESYINELTGENE